MALTVRDLCSPVRPLPIACQQRRSEADQGAGSGQALLAPHWGRDLSMWEQRGKPSQEPWKVLSPRAGHTAFLFHTLSQQLFPPAALVGTVGKGGTWHPETKPGTLWVGTDTASPQKALLGHGLEHSSFSFVQGSWGSPHS